jgi:predicted O-linked N-acetylglucosamine transferase (SPINDLY family)
MTLQQQLELGLSHHQAGRLAEAERIYRQVLLQQPDHAKALNLLGVLAEQAGRLDEALDLIQRAIQFRPDWPEAHGSLGNVLKDKGQFEQAIAAYRQAIRLKPGLGGAHSNLGVVLAELGRIDEAIAAYREAIRLEPNYAKAHNNLGSVLREKGQLEQAIASFRQAIRLKPDLVTAHTNLGDALKEKGQFDQAIAAHQRAIGLKPDYAEAHYNLGITLQAAGRLGEAIAAYMRALEIRSDYTKAHNNLGSALARVGQFDAAIATLRQAIGLKPDFAKAHNNLGNALRDTGQFDEAIAAYRRAIGLKPDFAEAHRNLIFMMNYLPGCDAKLTYEEHCRWSQQHAEPLKKFLQPHANERDPDRRLRIGYVSGDFQRHSVGYFLPALLEHHDRQFGDVFCYCNLQVFDDFTNRMKRACGHWQNIFGLSDQETASLIRSDAIDILVDLSGHTAGNRLAVFALKPAPVQVTYLGYPNTTGMTAMDYRLTDALADPPGMNDELNVEILWRLPGCAWCYDPVEAAPDVQVRGNGPVTFGCFNAFAKINEPLAAIWAQLLERVAGSRLLLKSAGAGAASAQRLLAEQFAKYGIFGERIEMRGWLADPRGHLSLYGQLDIALDTYPYNGTTTTCEALWMGVPVVSLAGKTHISRVGVSLLHNVGLPELIAQSPEKYVQIAADLAGDLPRLAELRRTMRDRMKASPLMDAPRFARNIESAYRQMWRNWCESGGA